MEAEEKKMIEIRTMANDWATQQYELKLVDGSIVEDMNSKANFFKEVWPQAMEQGEKLYAYVNSSVYKEKMKERTKPREQRSDYFWEGMDPKEKKRRQKILEKVTEQYLEAYAAGEDVDVFQLSEGGSSKE
jgi:ferritin